MAGEAVLSGFIQVLFEKVSTLALCEVDKFRSIKGLDQELNILSSTFSTLQALVEDAEEKQLNNKVIRNWLSRLKDIAYEMDELLDDYAAQNPKPRLEQINPNRWVKVKNYLSCVCLNNGLFKYQIVIQIKEIRQKLENLAKERDTLGLQMFGETSRLEVTDRPKTSSLVDTSSVFGRDQDKENIINMLLSPIKSSRGGAAVLPIVGMGGLGKTTLAQLVYNDPRIKDHFELRMWVYVSENFDEMKLTRETLESVSGSLTFLTTGMDQIQKDLWDKVKGKRFLLVLDDVWNQDPSKWHSYYNALSVAENESRIIVTTQNENVGRVMRGLSPYYLEQLSDEYCWKLFEDYAFVNGDSSDYPNLVDIGKEIVRKLKGLPLGAKALGSLLYSKVEEEAWRTILKSEIWELPPDKNNILPALRLSYTHLPPHLKQCFAFCSVFHKDYVFQKDKLVQIWIALGFVQPQGRRRLEDIGNGYFDDLVGRSFFQSHKGRFMMHDAIHNLAQSVSVDECHRLEENVRRVPSERIKHISFSCQNSKPTSFNTFFKFEKVRTLLLLRGYKSRTSKIPGELMIRLTCIRVLDLNRREIDEIPESIANLKQLRYLNISGTRVSKLPATITKLYNLQTLNIKYCDLLDELPRGITRLLNLRHLDISSRLLCNISGIGSFTYLQELEEFFVRKEEGYKIRELRGMNELGGRLTIQDLENVNTNIKASDGILTEKEYLTDLHLIWSDKRHVTLLEKQMEDQVLKCLRPNNQLKEITIKGFMGSMLPNWLINLSFIESIHLSDCKEIKTLPSLGKLRLLKYLDIGGSCDITSIGQEFVGSGDMPAFPSLTELVLQEMSNLEQWGYNENIEILPRLNELQLLQCPKLQHMPLLPPTLTSIRISESGFEVLPRAYISNSMTRPLLQSLQINDCPNLKSLQQGLLCQQLEYLNELTITDCEELVHIPLHGFKSFMSLKSLHIYNCPNLIPTGHDGTLLPPSIEDLRITSSNKIISPIISEISHLSSLAHLIITDCDDLVSFSVLPLGLKFFALFNCKNISSLPDLRGIETLMSLTIVDCPRIAYMPATGLPEMLQELHIRECPLLARSCQKGGNDWNKISHVPIIEISDDDDNVLHKTTITWGGAHYQQSTNRHNSVRYITS